MSQPIPIEKAKELFLKYFRVCGEINQSKESSIAFANKFIKINDEVEYWEEVIIEVENIEA